MASKSRTGTSSLLSAALVLSAGVALLAPSPAQASCALIPSTLKAIPSLDGEIDRPFASPGESVSIFSDDACKPSVEEPHFDLDPANNQITLIFEPPSGATAPVVAPFPATAVADCGDERCFALEFVIPDTSAQNGGLPLTGPARIEVRNQAAGGLLVAEIADLYERAIGCNPENRTLSLFEQFTVLPPPNAYSPGSGASALATLDGSGAILIPFDYTTVLPVALGGSGTVRILEINADIPNGLSAGNGLPGADGGFIRPPRGGNFVRSFSSAGRPLPPLLRVAASTPLSSGGVEYGDTIVGSVDFRRSVVRIAREAPNPAAPGTLQIFARNGEQGVAGPGLDNGVGPLLLSGIELSAGAAAPLNSVNASSDIAVVARDEQLEDQFGSGQQNADGDLDDRVPSFTSLSTNTTTTTGQAVVEAGAKAVIEAAASNVAFLQSEIYTNRSDLNGDGNTGGSIVRVWNADGTHPFCGGTPCDLTQGLALATATPNTQIFGKGTPNTLVLSGLVDPGNFLFFGRQEAAESSLSTLRISLDDTDSELNADSFDPHVDAFGTYVAFSSFADGPAGTVANGFSQIFARNAVTPGFGGTLISMTPGGDPGNGDSNNAFITNNLATVGFDSFATDLVAGDTEGQRDVFLWSGFSVTRLSENAGGVGGDGPSSHPHVEGNEVVFHSAATNLVPGDTNGALDVFLAPSSGGIERVSITHDGSQSNGDCSTANLAQGSTLVVFECLASNMVPGDTNGASDIFVRDRSAGTTTRISRGYGGTQANGASTNPSVTADGRFVVFMSQATNLVPPGPTLNATTQCYVYDRLKDTTELVSITLGGDGGNADCLDPYISPSAPNLLTFASASTNFHPRPGNNMTVYLHDRRVAATTLIASYGSTLTASVGPTGTRTALGLQGTFSFDSTATDFGITDTNGARDVYALEIQPGLSFNASGPFADADWFDVVLHVFDAGTRTVINTEIPIGPDSTSVAGGIAATTAFDTFASTNVGAYYDAESGAGLTVITTPPFIGSISISETTACAIDSSTGEIYVGTPGNATMTPTGAFSAARLFAEDGYCVSTDFSGVLQVTEDVSPFTTTSTNHVSIDFQTAPAGVAYRRCEGTAGVDLNGDGDIRPDECVMNYMDFATKIITETGHVAVQCVFPGCDPFFEPYRVGAGFVSFVTDEKLEIDFGGSGGTGESCLPNSPAGVCDKTGDKDGNDIAVEVFNLSSGRAQVFPLRRETPPSVPPFPKIMEGTTGENAMVLQLPAEILGVDFAMLPPQQLVTVIAGDPDGDAVFESDGNLDPATAVLDTCQEVADPTQADADGDGMGSDCDRTLTTGAANDDPVSAPAPALLPGENLCDLNRSGVISRLEVNKIFADRGATITQPRDHIQPLDGIPDATDDRDRDADGEITAVDFSLCFADCNAQPNGCRLNELGGSDSGYGCGLLGIEALVALWPLAMRQRRRTRVARRSER